MGIVGPAGDRAGRTPAPLLLSPMVVIARGASLALPEEVGRTEFRKLSPELGREIGMPSPALLETRRRPPRSGVLRSPLTVLLPLTIFSGLLVLSREIYNGHPVEAAKEAVRLAK